MVEIIKEAGRVADCDPRWSLVLFFVSLLISIPVYFDLRRKDKRKEITFRQKSILFIETFWFSVLSWSAVAGIFFLVKYLISINLFPSFCFFWKAFLICIGISFIIAVGDVVSKVISKNNKQ